MQRALAGLSNGRFWRGLNMTSNEWIAALDAWSVQGGAFPGNQQISTVDEAEVICRALRSHHILEKTGLSSVGLYDLAVLFQNVDTDTPDAVAVLHERGLPILHEILDAGLDKIAGTPTAEDDEAVLEAYIFVVKILAMYHHPGNTARIIKAARAPLLPDHYLWNVIASILLQGHPGAVEICEALANPLPGGFIGVVYLDLANGLSNAGDIGQHPFDCEEGIARLEAKLAPDTYEGDPSEAIGATVACAFLKDGATVERLLAKAEQYPDFKVQIEVAWARAKCGAEAGVERLAEIALDPRYASSAIQYLDELGLSHRIPSEASSDEFRVLAEMSEWLSHPSEVGRAPDVLEIYDHRELFWPPQEDRLPLWLVKFRYEPADGEEAEEGVGLVGSTTFVLFGATNASMPPEDIYALHCCYELHWGGDPRQPEERTAAEGRKLLAAHNPGFA